MTKTKQWILAVIVLLGVAPAAAYDCRMAPTLATPSAPSIA